MKSKRILIVFATLIASMSLVACEESQQTNKAISSKNRILNETTKKSMEKENKNESIKYIKDSGTIRIGKHGAIRIESETKAPITIDFFFDPVCKASAEYFESVKDVLKAEIESGNVELVLRPIPYLNEKTPDDYSNRASAYTLAVAEYAPTKIFAFISELMKLDFQPQNPATDITDDVKFIRAMEKAGLGKTEIDKVDANKENFVAQTIVAAGDFFVEDSQWFKFSNKPSEEEGKMMLYTPFVLVNKSGEYNLKAIEMTLNPSENLNNHIQNLLSKINEELKQSKLNNETSKLNIDFNEDKSDESSQPDETPES